MDKPLLIRVQSCTDCGARLTLQQAQEFYVCPRCQDDYHDRSYTLVQHCEGCGERLSRDRSTEFYYCIPCTVKD